MKYFLTAIVLINVAFGTNIIEGLYAMFTGEPTTLTTGVFSYNFARHEKALKLWDDRVGNLHSRDKIGDIKTRIPSRIRRTNDMIGSLPTNNLETLTFENEEAMLGMGSKFKTGVLAYVRNLDTFFGKLLGGWSPFMMGAPILENQPVAEAHTAEPEEIHIEDETEIPVETTDEAEIPVETKVEENPNEVEKEADEKSVAGDFIETTMDPVMIKGEENMEEKNGKETVVTFEKEVHSKDNLPTSKEIIESQLESQEMKSKPIGKDKDRVDDSAEKIYFDEDSNGIPELPKDHDEILSAVTDDALPANPKALRMVAINDARTGNLRGIDSINYECQMEAFEAGVDGLFRAFLSSEDLHLHKILSPSDSVDQLIVNSEGEILFNSYQDLISRKGKLNITNIIAPIYSFNKKNIIFEEHWPFNLVWHGQPDNEFVNGKTNTRCNEWTSEDPYLKGITSDYLFKGLLYTRKEPCDDTFIVLCIELGSKNYIDRLLSFEQYHQEINEYYEQFQSVNNFENEYYDEVDAVALNDMYRYEQFK